MDRFFSVPHVVHPMQPSPYIARRSASRKMLLIAAMAILALASDGRLVGQDSQRDSDVVPGDVVPGDPSQSDSVGGRSRENRLSRNNYSSRQQATLEMWRQRHLTRDEVQRAARNPDPEVAGRAKWILRQWRRGSLPETPPAISRLLQLSGDPSAITELLEGGQFHAAVVAVEESAGTADRELIQKRISAAITNRFPVYIKSALENESLPDLLKLIDLTAGTKEMAVCRVQLMQELGLQVDASSLLPTSSETWSQSQRHRASVVVLMVLGKPDEAVKLARESGDETLLHVCQMLAGRWSEMAIESVKAARLAEPGSYEHTRLWCQTLIASDRCERPAIFREAVEQLSATDTSDNASATDLRWKCLAGQGEVDAALTILEQIRPDAAAVLAFAASRNHRSFEAIGYSLDRVDLDIDDWVDDALESQRGEEELSADMRKLLSLMRSLLSIGRDDAAWAIATGVYHRGVDVGRVPLQAHLLSSLMRSPPRRDWVLRLAAEGGEDAFSRITLRILVQSLPDADEATFETLAQAIGELMPRYNFQQRLRIVYQLLGGEPDGVTDLDVDMKRLFDHLMGGKRQIQQLGGRVVLRPRLRINQTIASMFAMHGRVDLATKCLQHLVENGDVDATLQLAQRELDGGEVRAAGRLFELVWSRIEPHDRISRLRRSDIDANLAVRALVGQWTAARRAGDLQRSDELLRQLKLTLCSPSTETRNGLARHLGDRGELDLALEVYETLLPMTAFGTPEGAGFYQVAASFARLAGEVDAAGAARWYDLAVGGTLESTDYLTYYYILLPQDVRRRALEAAVQLNDTDAIRRHLRRIQQLDPLDINLAETLLPKMRLASMEALADKTFNQIIDRGLEHVKSFPFDATSCNNLAWVAAMNGQRLEDALALSENAVRLEPDSAIFRDTLAEVLFQLGRRKEALQVEESCLLDDPGQWHLHQQIEKYRQALAAP